MKKTSERKILNFIRSHYYLLGYCVLLIAVVYAYVAVLFNPREIISNIVYGLFFLVLIIGIILTLIAEKSDAKEISFMTLDGVFTMLGVFATYSIVHFLEVPVVLVSCGVGLLGHFLIRKFEVPIYCGSFAGMVSVALFGFWEVLVLALVCAVVFTLSKPIFKGYGGKLGTIAFLSSLIVHSIFLDEFIVVDMNLELWLLLMTTILGVFLTYCVHHYLKQTSVFASALCTMVFGILFIYVFPEHMDYVVVFFSASFIGMSSKRKLPNLIYVFLSGLILGLIFDMFIEFFNGLGGKLGLMAMISVIITSGVQVIIKKLTVKGEKTVEQPVKTE